MQTIEQVMAQLGNRLGIRLNMYDGAVNLKLDSGEEVAIEAPAQSALIVVQTEISQHASSRIFEQCMMLNSRLDLTKGAWLAFHRATNSFRLCYAVPVITATAEILEIVIQNLLGLSSDINSLLIKA
jgi:hypothetical protein